MVNRQLLYRVRTAPQRKRAVALSDKLTEMYNPFQIPSTLDQAKKALETPAHFTKSSPSNELKIQLNSNSSGNAARFPNPEALVSRLEGRQRRLPSGLISSGLEEGVGRERFAGGREEVGGSCERALALGASTMVVVDEWWVVEQEMRQLVFA